MILQFFRTHLLLVGIMIVYLTFSARNIFSSYLLRRTLEEGLPLPTRLSSFPVHDTSTAAYIASFTKVETFMNQVIELGSAELWLNSDDINNIHLKGVSVNKYRINPQSLFYPLIIPKYANDLFYFELQEHSLVRRRIRYPVLEGKDGISSETLEIIFEKVDSEFRVKRRCIEFNGSDIEANFRNNPVYQFLESTELLSPESIGSSFGLSNFLFHIMGATQAPNDNPERKCDSATYIRVSRIIDKIESLEIIGNSFIIKCN
jgi:hypothetical protein